LRKKNAKEEDEYENRATFWSLLAEEAADTIAELLLRKTIKTYLHEGLVTGARTPTQTSER
jgi:hypothetical protein